jgi:hypothetical protein
MRKALMRVLIGSALLSILVSGTGGCYVETGMIGAPEYAYGYPPVYYDGYMVYYDGLGRPFYYVNGAAVWVPPTVRVYPALVQHWRTYRPAYHRWYQQRGHVYRSYRFQGRRRH